MACLWDVLDAENVNESRRGLADKIAKLYADCERETVPNRWHEFIPLFMEKDITFHDVVFILHRCGATLEDLVPGIPSENRGDHLVSLTSVCKVSKISSEQRSILAHYLTGKELDHIGG